MIDSSPVDHSRKFPAFSTFSQSYGGFQSIGLPPVIIHFYMFLSGVFHEININKPSIFMGFWIGIFHELNQPSLISPVAGCARLAHSSSQDKACGSALEPWLEPGTQVPNDGPNYTKLHVCITVLLYYCITVEYDLI